MPDSGRESSAAGSDTPLVSIVIPSYVTSSQQADLLDEALRTVHAQTHRD